MANHGIRNAHVRRAAVLAAGIEAGVSGLVLRYRLEGVLASRAMEAARAVRSRLGRYGTASGESAATLSAAGGAGRELAGALHALSQDHPCAAARRLVSLAAMLYVLLVELAGGARGNRDGDAVA